jgi:hypothetical protein
VPYWLLKYAPHLVAVAVLIAGAALAVHKIREGVRDELAPKIDRLETELRAERATRIRAEMASSAYASELAALASRPVRSAPVRLCRDPGAVRPGYAAPRTDDPAPAAGSGAGSAGANLEQGPDIGPDLRELAAQCDSQNAKLRALQKWAQPTP